jgi:hypothetical protein
VDVDRVIEEAHYGWYTRMLRMALNVDWKQRQTNKEVYGNLSRVTMKIQERSMRLAGDIHRHPEPVANRMLLWEPIHGVRSRGRPAMTYVDSLRADTDLNDTGEMGGLISNRVLLRQRINTRTLKPP